MDDKIVGYMQVGAHKAEHLPLRQTNPLKESVLKT